MQVKNMLEVWGRKNSSNVMSVMWAIGELGLAHTRHNVGGTFGGTSEPPYSDLNPNGTVPTIRDDDMVMWESNAIVRYLAAKYGQGSLWPDDPAVRAQSDQWMEWTKTTLYPTFMPVFFTMIRLPPEQYDQQKIDTALAATSKVVVALERHLENNLFVAGDTLTMGDIPLGPLSYRFFNLDIPRPATPNVEAWYKRVCDRSAYQQHAMLPFGSNLAEWISLEKAGA